jgi:cysteinyl-tRNA synthetase
MGRTLGLLQQDPDAFLKRGAGTATLADDEIGKLLDARRAVRAAKNFAEADRIRALLVGAGVLLDDKPDGTTAWRRA